MARVGDDETVADLCPEARRADRSVDCQDHARLQDRGVSGDQFGLFQKAESRRPPAAERIGIARLLNDPCIFGVHRFGRHARAQGGQSRLLRGHGDVVDGGLVLGRIADPEGAVEAQLETVEVGHAAKAQEHRFAPAHDPGRGAVVRLGDLGARGHDLQEMRIGGHGGVAVILCQKGGGGACPGPGCRERHLVFRHAIPDRLAPGLHHGVCHLACVAGQLQLLFGLDHPHFGHQRRHITIGFGWHQSVHVIAHHRRHDVRLNPHAACHQPRQFGAPLRAQPVIPLCDPVHPRGGPGHFDLHRRRDQH